MDPQSDDQVQDHKVQLFEPETKPQFELQQIDEGKVSKKHLSYWETYKTDPQKQFNFPSSQNIQQKVCAKIIKPSDTVIVCENCQVDQTCVICEQCFQNGKHQGHKYYVKKAGSGCCDCGDKQAWKQEGFCKEHSGNFQDFTISEEKQIQFNKIMDGLIYQYFRMNIENHKDKKKYSKTIRKCLVRLNTSDIFYNKLVFNWMNRPLPEPYILPKPLDQRKILENILTYKISKHFIPDWFEFMMLLFPYSPSKEALLNHYMKNQSLLIDGQQDSIRYVRKLSIQLLTSSQLVADYAEKNNKGLASNFQVSKDVEECMYFLIHIFYDFDYIMKCSGDTPRKYWKMHLQDNIDIIFSYYELVKEKAEKLKKQKNKRNEELNIKYRRLATVELKLLNFMTKLVALIRSEPSLQPYLIKLIKMMLDKISADDKITNVVIFRPYERCLGILLFAYYQLDLRNVVENDEKLLEELGLEKGEFRKVCRTALTKIQTTFFEYSKCIINGSYLKSLDKYIEHYKKKSRLMSVTDIITIKILILMGTQPILNIQEIIDSPHESENQLKQSKEKQYNEEVIKQKQIYLKTILSEISLLYVSKSYQLFLAHEIDPTCEIYVEEKENLIQSFLKENNGVLKEESFEQLKKSLLYDDQSDVYNLMKQYADFDKEKKQFVCRQNLHSIGLNLNNFRINVGNKDKFEHPRKTTRLIKDYNIKIFSSLWNLESTKKLMKILQSLKQSGKQKQEQKKMILSFIFCIAVMQKENQQNYYELFYNVALENSDLVPEQIKHEFEKQKSTDLSEQNGSNQEKMRDKQKEMNQKRQKFLAQHPQDENEQVDSQTCNICRKNEGKDQFVYPANAFLRNHEKLLRIGNGVSCFAFSSCKHVFHESCLKDKFIQQKISRSLECPVCRKAANILLPIYGDDEKLQNKFKDRFVQIVFSFKEKVKEKEDSANDELLKSFYHFVMLALADQQYCYRKRLDIYRIFFRIVIKSFTSEEVKELFQLFKKNKLETKITKKKKQAEKDPERKGLWSRIISFFWRQPQPKKKKENEDQDNFQFDSEEEDKQLQVQEQYSDEFYATMLNLFKMLQKKECQQQKMFPIISQCLSSLQSEAEPIIFSAKVDPIIRNLPRYFTEIAEIKICSSCKKMSDKLIMCLVCKENEWVGCQQCENGKARSHSIALHGEVCAFMELKNGRICYLINRKFHKTGYAYEDEWGRHAEITKSWEKYELNLKIMRKLQTSLRHDEAEIS